MESSETAPLMRCHATSAGLPEPAADPKPVPPEKPLPMDCCESGCDRCVFDIYAEELAEYEAALAAWRERHPDSEPPTE